MTRARDLGIPFDGTPGKHNAITDVKGVCVGHTTLIEGEGKLNVGHGPIRTGVTAILPKGMTYDPVFASWYSFNGNGEITGTTWVEESGFLEGPIGLTNTHSVGVVRDAIAEWQYKNEHNNPIFSEVFWALPVVGETYDGILNDINGFHVNKQHAFDALNSATGGEVAEGAVGSGTGMICHGFKGGIGTASRLIEIEDSTYTIGVLVQANYGKREDLTIAGVKVGPEIEGHEAQFDFGKPKTETGSIIVIVATDAPLLPHQLKKLAQRVPLGLGRLGGFGANSSGDIFLAFSTANSKAAQRTGIATVQMLPNDDMNELMRGTIEATEEAIVNCLVSAETTTGINGNKAYALPHEQVQAILKKYNRLDDHS